MHLIYNVFATIQLIFKVNSLFCHIIFRMASLIYDTLKCPWLKKARNWFKFLDSFKMYCPVVELLQLVSVWEQRHLTSYDLALMLDCRCLILFPLSLNCCVYSSSSPFCNREKQLKPTICYSDSFTFWQTYRLKGATPLCYFFSIYIWKKHPFCKHTSLMHETELPLPIRQIELKKCVTKEILNF